MLFGEGQRFSQEGRLAPSQSCCLSGRSTINGHGAVADLRHPRDRYLQSIDTPQACNVYRYGSTEGGEEGGRGGGWDGSDCPRRRSLSSLTFSPSLPPSLPPSLLLRLLCFPGPGPQRGSSGSGRHRRVPPESRHPPHGHSHVQRP
jgi:hypothetical protein